MGVSISEVIALVYLWARYSVKRKKATLLAKALLEAASDILDVQISPTTAQNEAKAGQKSAVTTRQILRKIYSVAFPVTLGSLVIPL